ncbi:MAG: VWA domain-containing protein [Pyrinomonadaceae bacterium]
MPAHRLARRATRLTVLALLAACIVAPAQQPPQPQQQPQPQRPTPADAADVLRVTTEIVQTDVSVFDKEGKFVDNLTRDQFQLKVDGKPQPISFFERVVAGTVNEDAQLAAARGASRGGAAATSVPLDRGRVVVFFIDDLHLSPASLVSTRKVLSRFVDTQLRQNDQMAIATASNQLGFLSQLTDDKAPLRAAISRLNVRNQDEGLDRERPQLNIVQAIAIEQGHPDVLDYFIDQTIKENPAFATNDPGGGGSRDMARNYVQRRARQLIDVYSSLTARTLDALRVAIANFAQSPGRKLFYFVSDGFALEDARSSTYESVRRVTDAAVRAGAVVYTLDARGLSAQLADLPSASDNSSPDNSGRLAGAMLSLATATQEPLRTIADETGGRAILNTNAPDAGVARALRETSVYYLLAWKPEREENRGGKFRSIEVSIVGRPDLTVRGQHGFFAPTSGTNAKREAPAQPGAVASDGAGASQSPEQQARAKDLNAALRAPFPRNEVPTAVTLNYVKTKEGGVILSASVQVEIESSKPKPDGTLSTDRAEVLGAIYDDRGKLINMFQRGVGVTPKDASVEVPAILRLTFAFQSPVQPGLYQVRIASRDPKNRRTGSTSQWVSIPDVSHGAFTLSSIFLGLNPAAPEDKQADATGSQVLVVPDRRFARGEPLRFVVYAYNAALGADGKPDVAMQLQIFRDDQPVVTAPLSRLDAAGFADFARQPYAAEVSLKGLPVGHYELRLTAIDRAAKASATQQIKFTVE